MFGSSLPWPGSASARPRGEAIPAQFVKPLVKSNKNDFLDAEAIAEAVDRQNMRFVSIKTDGQLDLQAMHHVRDRLVARRTSVINQLRAFLLERGMVFPQDSLQAEAGDAEDPRPRSRSHSQSSCGDNAGTPRQVRRYSLPS